MYGLQVPEEKHFLCSVIKKLSTATLHSSIATFFSLGEVQLHMFLYIISHALFVCKQKALEEGEALWEDSLRIWQH